MGKYCSSGTPGVRWRPLESYAAGESLLNSSGDCVYAGLLLGSQLALTFSFFTKVRNPGGKQTPQDSIDFSPNHRSIEHIEELLASAKTSHSALEDLVSPTSRLDARLRSVVGHPPRWRPLSTHRIFFLPSSCCDTPLCSYHPVFYQLKGASIPWMMLFLFIYFSRHKHMLQLKCLQAARWTPKPYMII